ELVAQELHGDVAVEGGVAGAVDDSHSAAPSFFAFLVPLREHRTASAANECRRVARVLCPAGSEFRFRRHARNPLRSLILMRCCDRTRNALRTGSFPNRPLHPFGTHTGGGVIASSGRSPTPLRPLPASRLMHFTLMSASHAIWQLRRTPVKPRAART